MSDFDTIIVGAGIAGLTAARELSRSSKNVLMLEGDSDIGGRAKSKTLPGGQVINPGAHWFHGGDDNQFFQSANAEFNLEPLILDKGKYEGIDWAAGQLAETFNEAYDQIEKAYKNNKEMSLYQAARAARAIHCPEVAEYMAHIWVAANSAKEVACKDIFNSNLGYGGWQLQNGMSHLIRCMAEEPLRRGVNIQKDCVVRRIEERGGEARVHLEDGRVVSAGHVLVTVPVGVLQSGLIAFDPQVESVIQEKTHGLKSGDYFKGTLCLRREFFENRSIAVDSGWDGLRSWNDHYFVHARTAGSNVITFFRGGKQALEAERMSPQKLKNRIVKILQGIPEFEGVESHIVGEAFGTSWSSNRLACGAYSYCQPGGQRSDPFRVGRIAFAGEAFVADYADEPSHTMGAWRSGQIASKLLLQLA